MKKIFLTALVAAASVLPSAAQFVGNGHYRIQNANSERYACLIDDQGSVDIPSMSGDLGALRTFKPFSKVVSDPASIIYIQDMGSDNNYNLKAQGVDAHSFIGYFVKLMKNADGTYKAYQQKSGQVIFLSDTDNSAGDLGMVNTNEKNYRNWNILPVSSSSDNYFGVKPTQTVGDKHYASFYIMFPFSFHSAGMKAYYVDKLNAQQGVATVKEVSDVVPGAAPVIIECSSEEPADNKLDFVENTASVPADNLLSGNYFDSDYWAHEHHLANDPATMRIFGVTSAGKIGFVKSSLENVPANVAYLMVPEGAADEINIVDEKDFEAAGISDMAAGVETKAADVYTLSGVKVRQNATSLNGLSKGVYIYKGKKVVID